MYGATPIEDIPYYNVIVRQLTEWTGTNQMAAADQFSVTDGIGGIAPGNSGQQGEATINRSDSINNVPQNGARQPLNYINVRQKHIHGIDLSCAPYNTGIGQNAVLVVNANNMDGTTTAFSSGHGVVPNQSTNAPLTLQSASLNGAPKVHTAITGTNPTRRYQVQLALGIFNQEKLIPTKFMASQLAIEITLENPQACMYYTPSTVFSCGNAQTVASVVSLAPHGIPATTPPSYQVTNVNLIPEILEFDASYDESFLKGLQTGGVPIKFATWNNYRFPNNGVNSVNLQIQERSRSVKAIFCMQRRAPETFGTDSGAAFFNTAVTGSSNVNGASTFQEYQYRIGGR